MTANTNLGVKVSQLPTVANLAVTDSFVVLSNTTGTPSVRTIQFGTVGANLVISQNSPANSSAAGVVGTICYDNSYLYVCTSNGWVRTALQTF